MPHEKENRDEEENFPFPSFMRFLSIPLHTILKLYQYLLLNFAQNHCTSLKSLENPSTSYMKAIWIFIASHLMFLILRAKEMPQKRKCFLVKLNFSSIISMLLLLLFPLRRIFLCDKIFKVLLIFVFLTWNFLIRSLLQISWHFCILDFCIWRRPRQTCFHTSGIFLSPTLYVILKLINCLATKSWVTTLEEFHKHDTNLSLFPLPSPFSMLRKMKKAPHWMRKEKIWVFIIHNIQRDTFSI